MPQLGAEYKTGERAQGARNLPIFRVWARSWSAGDLYSMGRLPYHCGSDCFELAMAKLIVISGEERQEFELAAFNTIGRHPDNTIQILDRIISKEHAQIQRSADGRFLLRDLRSLNGTFL